MEHSHLIVSEYLESLKEDTELDRLFPILLSLMGFSIIATARESKGQPQYGKDIVAIGRDASGVKSRFYFELKGNADKDINHQSFFKPDGIRESILEAKTANFDDSSIPGFNALPIIIVVVHNGVLKVNARKTFQDFIAKEFPTGGFERWDIYKLSELFQQYLFGEALLTEGRNIKLFKKTLVLLDSPDYDLSDFKSLIKNLLSDVPKIKSRAFTKLFATLNLVSTIIFHYSREAENLSVAKEAITFLVLKTWSWILKINAENKEAVVREFRKLLNIYHELLNEYFFKTLPAAKTKDGLFAENGGFFESVGYPIRAMEYLSYLIYFCAQRKYWPKFDGNVKLNKKIRLEQLQKEVLLRIAFLNDGCQRPLLDGHYIPIVHFVLFFFQATYLTEQEKIAVHNYIVNIFNNLLLVKSQRDRLPEFYDNVKSLIEFAASNNRPFDYSDDSSILITVLFELLVLLDGDQFYCEAYKEFAKIANLQLPFPSDKNPGFNLEESYFSGNIYDNTYAETSIQIPEKFNEFKSLLVSKNAKPVEFRTDKAGFPFLKILASIYYKNDVFPDEWRSMLSNKVEFEKFLLIIGLLNSEYDWSHGYSDYNCPSK